MPVLFCIERIRNPVLQRVSSIIFLDVYVYRSVQPFRPFQSRCSMGIEIPHSVPVPPDYEISRRANLKHISEIAKSLGLKESEYSLYGSYQAKVRMYQCVRGYKRTRLGLRVLRGISLEPSPLAMKSAE